MSSLAPPGPHIPHSFTGGNLDAKPFWGPNINSTARARLGLGLALDLDMTCSHDYRPIISSFISTMRLEGSNLEFALELYPLLPP